MQDFFTVTAVHAAGFEGEILSVHLRQGQRLGLVVEGHHRYNGIGPGTAPGKAEGTLGPRHLQHHIGTAVVTVLPDKGLAFLRLTGQHLGIVLPDKGQPGRILLADDDALWLLQQGAQQGADARGACADDKHRILPVDFRNPGRPEAGGQNVAYEQGLFIGNPLRDFIQALVGIGHTDKLRLSAVDSAAQGPPSIGVGAVIHPTILAEIALAAKGLHIHRHPVPEAQLLHLGAHGLHHAHHLMAHGDAGHRPGHGAMLDVQVTGTDGAQSHPHNGIPGILQHRLRLVQKGKMVMFDISQCLHSVPPLVFFFSGHC